jgi:hypothetical protein
MESINIMDKNQNCSGALNTEESLPGGTNIQN